MTKFGPTRFGTGDRIYEFPALIEAWTDNFTTLMTDFTRIPGMSGGIDNYGRGAAPSDLGRVTVIFWLVASNRAAMAQMKDNVKRLAGWGRQRLWLQPFDLAMSPRFCNARVKRIDMPEDASRTTDLSQRITIDFEVPDARWYVPSQLSPPTWGGGATWGEGYLWGGSFPETAYSGVGPVDITVTNNGTAETFPTLRIEADPSAQLTNLTIQRIENSLVVDEIEFDLVIDGGDTLIIDTKTLTARVGSTDVYNAMTPLRPSWLRLPPGDNLLRFTTTNASDEGSIAVIYDEAYY